MIKHVRIIALLIVVATALAAIVPTAGLASVRGRRNTAWVLTAGTAYAALKGHKGTAIALGAGSAYAWKRAHDERMQNERRAYYRSRHHGYVPYRTYGGGGRYYRHHDHGRHAGWSHSRYYRSRRH